ncbi:DUF3833 domain-containing protein [Aurantivibrio plasticivorans]
MMLNKLFVFFLSLTLIGCSSVQVTDYENNQPKLQLTEFFNGKLTAHGVLKNYSGKVTRRFNATIDASWSDGGIGTLDEHFEFDDGETQTRVWTLTPIGNGEYTATAGDVVGSGQASVAGNALFLDYVLRVPYNDGTLDVRIDDRMYLINDTTLINESVMIKFGVQVAEIVLVILKVE